MHTLNLPYSAALSSWAQLRGIHRAAKFTHPGQGGVEVLHPEEQVGQRALVTAVQPAGDAGGADHGPALTGRSGA
ncbi:hypothetical protein [Pseudarthrobacter sp. Y6]|uniref:hypothetical protein n=1 Tax=Pseudarthrobacter sp. Y6 TaxID=3418422 RepID=UPI003CF8998E